MAEHDDGLARRNVFWLGMVSLFTDLSSQMVVPLIPAFLEDLGASKKIIGLIEGIAESTASLLRTVFGRISDKLRKRKLFIYCGYGLSALARPFLFLAGSWAPVLGVRFADRVGKAARTPARDALISTSVGSGKRGRAFGFQRAMDRLGAVGGPLLAMLVLYLCRGRDDGIRIVFLVSVVPGLLALGFVPFAKETAQSLRKSEVKRSSGLKSPAFIVFLVASIIFTLGNAANSMLTLKAIDAGLGIALVPAVWALYNVVCTISAPVFGFLSDKKGRPPVLIASFVYYAAVYFLFGLANRQWQVWALFAAYGVYYGLSDGVLRAYIADLVEPENRATAYGIFNTGIGLALLPASVIFGAVWDEHGSRWAFFVAAGFSLLGFLVFLVSLAFRPHKEGVQGTPTR